MVQVPPHHVSRAYSEAQNKIQEVRTEAIRVHGGAGSVELQATAYGCLRQAIDTVANHSGVMPHEAAHVVQQGSRGGGHSNNNQPFDVRNNNNNPLGVRNDNNQEMMSPRQRGRAPTRTCCCKVASRHRFRWLIIASSPAEMTGSAASNDMGRHIRHPAVRHIQSHSHEGLRPSGVNRFRTGAAPAPVRRLRWGLRYVRDRMVQRWYRWRDVCCAGMAGGGHTALVPLHGDFDRLTVPWFQCGQVGPINQDSDTPRHPRAP